MNRGRCQSVADLEAAKDELPPPRCTYADHSYPAYSKQQVLEILAKQHSADALDAQRMSDTVAKAADDARYVFKDSCSHTHQAIDYMKAVLDAAMAEPPAPEVKS